MSQKRRKTEQREHHFFDIYCIDKQVLSVYENVPNDATFSGDMVEVREMKRFKGFVHRTNYMERIIELANQR